MASIIEDGSVFSDSIDGKHIYLNSHSEWKPLSLTLVEYPKGDYIGLGLAVISLMPFAIIASFITLIIFRRDMHTISFFGGVVLNEVLNFILKHTIQQARPMRRDGLYSEYGMPSTHSQFMWFFATYITLFVIFRLHKSNNTSVSESFWRVLIITLSIFSAVTVCYSRIYLQYHSFAQVFWGTILGIFLAACWFVVVHFILTPIFPLIVSWKISEYLLLRDTTLIPNILWFEYTNARSESRARSRKLVSMKSQ